MKPSRITFVESPYNHPTLPRRECVRYALWACVDSTLGGDAVFASHLFYTLFLPEDPMGREWGLLCRDFLARRTLALIARYTDIGETPGMFRDVDCTAVVESRRLQGEALAGWQEGRWPEGSLRVI